MARLSHVSSSRTNGIPNLIIGFGGILLLSVFGEQIILGESGLNFYLSIDFLSDFATTSPFVLGIMYGGYWLDRSELTPDRYVRIAKWLLGGAVVVLGINLFVMSVVPTELDLPYLLSWGRFAIGMGAASGLLIGLIEGRALHRERALGGYRAIFEQVEDAILVHDAETFAIQDANPKAVDLFGYSIEELQDMSVIDFTSDHPGFDDSQVKEKLTAAKRGETPRFEWAIERPDGEIRWIDVALKRATIRDDLRLLAVVRDISDKKAHRKELEQYETLVETVQDGLYATDTAGQFTFANDAFVALTGYDREELLGKHFSSLYRDEVPELGQDLEQNPDDERAVEFSLVRDDGDTVPVEARFTRLAPGGEFTGITGVVRDVTERKEHEKQLNIRSAAMETSMDGIAIVDEDGNYRYANHAHAEVYGYDDPEAFLGKLWHMCYTDEELGLIEEDVLPELIEEGSWRGELTGLQRDGETFPQELSLTIMDDGGLVGVVRDISDRKEYEDQLRELHDVSREFYSMDSVGDIATELVSAAHDMLSFPLTAVWEYDAGSNQLIPLSVADSARRFAEKAGLQELPVLEEGSAEMELFHNDESVLVDDYGTLENRQTPQMPLGAVLFVPLGEHGLAAIGSPDPGEISEAELILWELLASNATAAMDRLMDEQELATQAQRLRTIVENLPVILFTVDRSRKVTLQVGKGLEEVGVEPNQMVGATVEDMFGDSPLVLDAIDQAFDGNSVDLSIDIWGHSYQVWYQPIADGDEVTSVIGVAMDVTERQKRERGIQALHDATREMMQETDHESICQIAVDTAQNALGLPVSAIWLRPDDHSRLEPVAWSTQADELFDEMPVFESDNSISWQVYEEGEPRIYDDVRDADARFNPETTIQSDLIVPIGEYGVLNSGSTDAGQFDETDVVLAQLLAANTRSALERAEREAALQRKTDQMEFFNSILRHDVLNGMTVIRGRAEFLAEEVDGDQLRDAETILKWCNDVVEIVQRVRATLDTLTGQRNIQLKPVPLSETLHLELDRVRETYPEVTFDTSIPDAVHVQATELLSEVLGNVVTNAVHHNDTDGLRVSVTTSESEDDKICVRIADNGTGVPDEYKETIFRRDATGHAKSSGSGFGLFFVDSMVGQYGGDVWVEGNEMGGATFVIELPLAETTAPISKD